MKQIILIVSLLSLYSLQGFSQVTTTEEDGTVNMDNYIFTRPARVVLCKDVDGHVDSSHLEYYDVPKGYKFQLVDILDNGYAIIQFWEFDSTSKKKSAVNNKALIDTFNYTNGDVRQPRFFRVSPKDWQDKVVKRYSTNLIPKKGQPWFTGTSITGGVVILPYKFRPNLRVKGVIKGYDFSKDITLGISGGLRQRISHYKPYYLNVLGNFGVSNVTETPFNTDSTLKDSRDVPAFTAAIAIVADFKNIQFGISLGWDKVSDSNKNNWIYESQPWISVGFGYSIFSVSTAHSSAATGQNGN